MQGTLLIREWNGQTIAVEITDSGTFQWRERNYRSLSEIARLVKGAHWSGPRFLASSAMAEKFQRCVVYARK